MSLLVCILSFIFGLLAGVFLTCIISINRVNKERRERDEENDKERKAVDL